MLKKLLAAFIILTSFAFASEHKYTHTLTEVLVGNGGTCSATIIGPHAILTAFHCIDKGAVYLLDAEETPLVVKEILSDTKDHAIIVVDKRQWAEWATFGKTPKVKDKVHFWGNPDGWKDLYREGSLIGYADGKTLYDINSFYGDSGAAIFNRHGKIVGCVSGMYRDVRMGLQFKLTAGMPFAFTPAQLAEAQQ